VSACFSIFVPATEPSATATTQNTSQAETAVFQWSPLHRAARAEMFDFISPS
jgi:hypothetical protein